MKKCAAFWKHTNLRNNNNIFPCCRFKRPVGIFNGNVSEILHSDAYKKLRATDVSTIPECSKCMYEEENGKKSLRQKFNEKYDTETIGIEFLEVGLDNICNLTCDGCWAEFSSSWSEKQFPDKPRSYHIRTSKDIEELPDTLNKILFLGGEPLMTKRHYKILQKIKTPSKVEVTYNTNGTFLLDNATLELLHKFKKVNFILSIDGYGKLNDKVRSGSKWSEILLFIDQIKQTSFNLSVNSVLHLNNWHGFLDLEKFINDIDVEWEVNILTYPKHLDIANYENKQEVLDLIEQTNIPNKEYVTNHLL
jgi:sulfatase maturation enzyme AslB (radical SAM superfamily)